MTTSEPKSRPQWLGRHPWRTALRTAAVLTGVGATGWLIGLVWPEPDQVAAGASPTLDNPANLAAYPGDAVTLLLVGIDADQVGDSSNGAAPAGPANADALMLVRIDPSRSLELLQLPTELAVLPPGSSSATSLAGLWRDGGVQLLTDAIREIVGLDEGHPQRFAVVPRAALRELVDRLGSVDLVLKRSYDLDDRSQDYRVKLEAGRQNLNGSEAEQLVRYRQNPNDNPGRRERQQLLIRALVAQVQAPEGISLLPGMLGAVTPLLETNLSQGELLSLVAAALASPEPLQIRQLVLADRPGDKPLRQLRPGQSLPLWPPS